MKNFQTFSNALDAVKTIYKPTEVIRLVLAQVPYLFANVRVTIQKRCIPTEWRDPSQHSRLQDVGHYNTLYGL